MERILCSLLSDSELESSADLTAETRPERLSVARETVAVEPCPMVRPRVQSIVKSIWR